MLRIRGEKRLVGKPVISGAKNSMQFLVNIALLTDEMVTLSNVPLIKDLEILCDTLKVLNCHVDLNRDKKTVDICACSINNTPLDFKNLSRVRSSILLIPGLLHRFGSAFLPYPGGDKIGSRPLDTHFYILTEFGVDIELEEKGFKAEASNMRATELYLPFPSFTGTGMAIMIAAKLKGKTTIYNASKEPELNDLSDIFIKMGVDISGVGTDKITIVSSGYLNSAEIEVMPDRLETGTLLLSAIATKGKLTVDKNDLKYLSALTEVLYNAGCYFHEDGNTITIGSFNELKPIHIKTLPFPGFPTDLQPQIMALMTQISGENKIIENLHDNRFLHVPYLNKMGADIKIEGKTAVINGRTDLNGTEIEGLDIRGATSLVIAALSARGDSIFKGTYHLDRGYFNLCENLIGLGADICSVKDKEV